MLLARRGNLDQYRRLVERLEELDLDYYVHQRLSRSSYLACRGGIDDELTRHAAKSGLPQAEGLPRGFDIRHAKSAWLVLTIEQRRAVLQAVIASITVHRATRRGSFDPGRLTVAWRL